MNNNLNIEDFFRNSFDGHSIEPKSKVWNGISKKLWIRQFGDFFKFSFENYQVNPSANLWNRISRKLWFLNFLRFNPASFNIYYLGLTVSVISGIILSSELNSKQANTLQNNSVILNNYNSPVIKNQQNSVATNTDNVVNTTKNPVHNQLSETKNNYQTVTVKSKNPNQYKNIIPVENKINNQVRNNNKTINNNSITTPVFFKDKGINTKDNFSDQKLTALNSETKNLKNADLKIASDIIEQKLLLTLLQPRSSMLPITNGSDVFIPDTLGFDFNYKPIILDRVHWTVDIWWSPIHNSTLFTAKTPEFIEYTGMLKNATSDDITYSSYGTDLNYSYKNLIFQVGVSYTELGQKMKIPNTVSDNRQSSYYNYFENKFIIHDTIWFLDLDSLLQHDTVWIGKPIETWIVQKDSNLITKYDTLKTTNHFNVSNRYSYLEIPFMVGYEIRKGKFSYSMKGGVATGFFIRSSGSIPSQNESESISLNNSDLPYIKPNFTLLFSIGINYYLNDKIAVFGEPYVRKNINSIFENRYIYSQKFQSFGVKFGIKYTFK